MDVRAISDDLTPEMVEANYPKGLFPMANPGWGVVTWHCPSHRAVIPLDAFHVSRSLDRTLRKGAFEAVMRNYRGEIAECAQSNIFIVKDGVALTPPVDAGLLVGITREFLFEVAREVGVPMREQVIRDVDLFGADECFLTSTTREVVPIVRVDEHVIGSGKPGPITLQLLRAFQAHARAQAAVETTNTVRR